MTFTTKENEIFCLIVLNALRLNLIVNGNLLKSSDIKAMSAVSSAEMASTLSSDDVRLIVGSAPEAPAVNDLTPKEREAFVKLLGVELGGLHNLAHGRGYARPGAFYTNRQVMSRTGS